MNKNFGPIQHRELLKGDAGHRRYTRLISEDRQVIWAEDNQPKSLDQYLNIHTLLAHNGCNVPQIFAIEKTQGWLLVEDLGTQTLLDLWPLDHGHYLDRTLQQLVAMNQIILPRSLPFFNQNHIIQEFKYCKDWFFGYAFSALSHDETLIFDAFSHSVAEQLVKFDQGFIHRDFHSANLMAYQDDLVLIDFQDAMWGPKGYDVASLAYDCYMDWPQDQKENWLKQAQTQLSLARDEIDLIALQRLIKVLGIFSRLKYRDQKPKYMQYLPRMFAYLKDLFTHFSEHHSTALLFKERGCW
ncbi:MAG: aminoglycoside phosphotransferase family protein [Candidatus Comchoanobacterales bacterium]